MITVQAIQRSAALALLSDDTTVPITVWLDADGDETTNLDEGVAFVAGCDERGIWFAESLLDFPEAPAQ